MVNSSPLEDYSSSRPARSPGFAYLSGRAPGPEIAVRRVGYGYLVTKRALDITIALLVLATTWPIMLVMAAIIRRKSGGPALFRQTRMGRCRRNYRKLIRPPAWRSNGRLARVESASGTLGAPRPERRRQDLLGQPFTFYKFQTMYPDARERFPELYAYDYSPEEIQTLKFKRPDDPRHLPGTRWMRKTSLDELPNFINVLLGNMSVVGPRPDIPEMMRYYTEEQAMKLWVKPGVTGPAQIHGRGNLTFQETLAWDLHYVRHRSLWYDLKILVLTLVATVKGGGAF